MYIYYNNHSPISYTPSHYILYMTICVSKFYTHCNKNACVQAYVFVYNKAVSQCYIIYRHMYILERIVYMIMVVATHTPTFTPYFSPLLPRVFHALGYAVDGHDQGVLEQGLGRLIVVVVL